MPFFDSGLNDSQPFRRYEIGRQTLGTGTNVLCFASLTGCFFKYSFQMETARATFDADAGLKSMPLYLMKKLRHLF
jgi:hypothetical protein